MKFGNLVSYYKEVVYVSIGNPASCLALYLTGIYLRGELHHVGDVSEPKIKCPLEKSMVSDCKTNYMKRKTFMKKFYKN